jgi:L-asparaginase
MMNNHFMAAPWVRKRSTRGVDAFEWPMDAYGEALLSSGAKSDGMEGSMGQYAACLDAQTSSPSNHPSSGQDDAQSGSQARRLWNTLEVHVLYCTPGLVTLKQLQSLSNRVAFGDTRVVCVVVAAPGHGNIPELLVPDLQRLLAAGVNVVRASRVGEGGVRLGGEPDALEPVPGKPKLPGQVFLQGHLSLGQVVVRERLRSLAVLLAK